MGMKESVEKKSPPFLLHVPFFFSVYIYFTLFHRLLFVSLVPNSRCMMTYYYWFKLTVTKWNLGLVGESSKWEMVLTLGSLKSAIPIVNRDNYDMECEDEDNIPPRSLKCSGQGVQCKWPDSRCTERCQEKGLQNLVLQPAGCGQNHLPLSFSHQEFSWDRLLQSKFFLSKLK